MWSTIFNHNRRETPRPSFYLPISADRTEEWQVCSQHAGRQPSQTTRSSLPSRWLPFTHSRHPLATQTSPADIVNFLSQEFPIDPRSLPTCLTQRARRSTFCSTFCTRFPPLPSPIDPFIPSWVSNIVARNTVTSPPSPPKRGRVALEARNK